MSTEETLKDPQKQQPQDANQPQKKAEKMTKKAVEENPSLGEAIAEQAREDEQPQSSNFTLREILGGDILTTHTIRHQIWLIILIVGFVIVYVSNRYSCQKDLLEIDRLTEQLKDAKYKALSTSSQLTEKTRESNILRMLKNRKDSVLHIATQPPYIIQVPQ